MATMYYGRELKTDIRDSEKGGGLSQPTICHIQLHDNFEEQNTTEDNLWAVQGASILAHKVKKTGWRSFCVRLSYLKASTNCKLSS